ncbi:MAG TPA: HD domain-containing protein [Thermomicrobiaceae bacterium]|nr:HD domain-containing protein [Thermomicrobiaceae bacterium]
MHSRGTEQPSFTHIRDSLYDRITLTRAETHVIETEPFLRLDGIEQLGFVSAVWPGAKHTRFEHSLGVAHLMRQAVRRVRAGTSGNEIDDEAERTAVAAALLHDIGHYPFSHAIEELGPPIAPHEQVGRRIIERSPIADVLANELWVDPGRVAGLIDPRGAAEPLSPVDQLLRGLLSGPLDVDKLDYLPRDARSCNVPYGGVDAVRLIDALRVAEVDGIQRIVLDEKGISPLHSLINARQEMFDNVYWHHANRACMVMLLRAVQEALVADCIEPDELSRHDDASLLARLSRPEMPSATRALTDSLRRRRLHKRAIEISSRSGPLYQSYNSLYADPARRRRVEMSLARDLAAALGPPVEPYEILIDIPKPERWRTDVWIQFERPPIGMSELMSWTAVSGLTDETLKRYEEHRRLIRIVTTERLRDEVARRSDALLLPLLGGAMATADD